MAVLVVCELFVLGAKDYSHLCLRNDETTSIDDGRFVN